MSDGTVSRRIKYCLNTKLSLAWFLPLSYSCAMFILSIVPHTPQVVAPTLFECHQHCLTYQAVQRVETTKASYNTITTGMQSVIMWTLMRVINLFFFFFFFLVPLMCASGLLLPLTLDFEPFLFGEFEPCYVAGNCRVEKVEKCQGLNFLSDGIANAIL